MTSAQESGPSIPRTLAARLHEQARADRWSLSPAVFAQALQASVDRTFAGRSVPARDVERYLTSLHLEDLALACGCAAGHEAAWDHFIMQHRPVLYRAADALEPGGGARELADSLYADLYGLDTRKGERRSLFRYFSGRSSLATWLRSVLAQRLVDRVRAGRRLEPLPDDPDDLAGTRRGTDVPPDPDRLRLRALVRHALTVALGALGARDRLRLSCYYAQQLTLAQTGRLLGEHEATVSRHLARTRRALRDGVERHLANDAGLHPDQIAQCFAYVLDDPGPLDLSRMLEP